MVEEQALILILLYPPVAARGRLQTASTASYRVEACGVLWSWVEQQKSRVLQCLVTSAVVVQSKKTQ